MSKIRYFFTEEEEAQVIEAIQKAELATSGEIRVHIEKKCKDEAIKRAIAVFEKLNMQATELRNGVLFYLATEDHKFSIIGDEGIDKVVPEHYWEGIRDEMQKHFKEKDFVGGLTIGIDQAGQALSKYFPYQDDDENELSDEISTS